MDDPLLVRCEERFGNLPRNGERFAHPQRPPLDTFVEGWSLDQFEDQPCDAVALLDTVDGSNVRMVQRREDARFTGKTRTPLWVSYELWPQDFDGDVPPSLLSCAQ